MSKFERLLNLHTSSRVPLRDAVAGPRPNAAAAVPHLRANRTAVVYACVAASIIIALIPALFFTYGYHNDFNAWGYDSHTCCDQHPETRILLGVGRYFASVAENLQFFTIHNLDDLWLWRLIGILSTAALAAYYLHVVSLGRSPTWLNACLSVAVFTLPTMQFQAIWPSMYTMWTPPILLSLMAAQLLLKAGEGDFFANRFARRRATRLTLQAFAVLLAGLFFYPISATFVLVPTAHLLLNEKQYSRRIRRMALLATVVLGSGFVALFVIHKFIVLPHLSNVPYLGDYQFKFAGNVAAEATRRLDTYFLGGAYLWLGLEIPGSQALIGLAAIIGVAYLVIRGLRRSIEQGELLNFLIGCSLFLVAAAPLLVVHQFAQTYRSLFTMTAIEMLALFWLLRQLPIAALRLAAIFAVLGIVCSFADVYGTSASAHAEYAIYARSVANLTPHKFHSIVILRPNLPRKAFGLDLMNDYGSLAPIPSVFDLLIGPRYKGEAAFEVETLRMPLDYPRALEQNDATIPLAIAKDAVVIDTSSIYGLPDFADVSSQLATVSGRPHGDNGPVNAVDGDPNSYWQVCGNQPFPIELKLIFPAAHTLQAYSLSTVEETDRMPTNWEIWVSSDGLNWRQLQKETDARPWQGGEERHYDVEPASDIAGVKLVITATRAKSCMRLYEFRPIFGQVDEQ
jgi:hypothetical protein